MYEISEDDDSFTDFTEPGCSRGSKNNVIDSISLSSDEELSTNRPDGPIDISSSDSEDLPEVEVVQKTNAIKKLFSAKNGHTEDLKKSKVSKNLFSKKEPVAPSIVRHISGVPVNLPVEPYPSQIALMSLIIKGIKESKNCILESPTGSGKTLALLCGALAWQNHERNRLVKENIEPHYKDYPELDNKDVTDYIASPLKRPNISPEQLFSKSSFGEKSIYQKQTEEQTVPSTSTMKRPGPYMDLEDCDEESPTEGLVSIQKKRRQGSVSRDDITIANPPNAAVTPDKSIKVETKPTPENVRKMVDIIKELQIRTPFIDCSLPTIYYGARTHAQLQQVIDEFKRTSYCGLATMSLLSSRDKSCIREFNRDQWSSVNDMCRACIKATGNVNSNKPKDSNCKYYENRRHLNHDTLPPAFDLKELEEIGKERQACPYYGAREMAKVANIIFCPYDYLIDPIIRRSLHIDLTGNIIVIDEAHNIENKCRDVASFSFTQTQVQVALQELKKVAEYRYANHDAQSYIEDLIQTLKNWDEWFQNQTPLINAKPLNNNQAEFTWEAKDFVTTLDNHNIGYQQYNKFMNNADLFCRRLREDPRTLLGVAQATGALVEALAAVLGYLFRDECKHVDDFKPALERTVSGRTSMLSDNTGWQNSTFNKWISTDALSLSLHCLNPAVAAAPLRQARCLVLASGTLTPVGNIHAELGTAFPINVSRDHVIARDRVWVGVVTGDAKARQGYTYNDMKAPATAERLGKLIRTVCEVTPHGVLCFISSYPTLDTFKNKWQETGLWGELQRLKHVFWEKKKADQHKLMMDEFQDCVGTDKGALLFAVYRGKVSEGMDFRDHQARAVICVGVPYPFLGNTAVQAKMQYNLRYEPRGLLAGRRWLQVQAFRALNQAVGRCVRHKNDWGAVLLVDERFTKPDNYEHLSKWVLKFLRGTNYHTHESLTSSDDGLAAFMRRMKISDEQADSKA